MADDVTTDVLGSRGRSGSDVRQLVPGSHVGAWHITRMLGGGGFGAVYEATHERTRQRAALKLLHAHFTTSPEMLARFEREIDVLRRLAHPNVVRLVEGGFSDDERPYLCMELLDGTELGKVIATSGPLSPSHALSILAQLCDALGRAHELGIVHRDIKASNVMICSADADLPPRVVLLDFGIAKISDALAPELTASRQSLGTPSCMAPEQIQGGRVDARTDVYSLGGLLFHMLTGRQPFEDSSPTMIQYLHLHARRPVLSAATRAPTLLDEVIARAMAIDPNDRYPDCGSFYAAARSAIHSRSMRQVSGEVPCIALLVSVGGPSGALDAALLDDLESVLPAAERELVARGFQLVVDLGSSALFVAQADAAGDPIATANTLYDQLLRRPGRDPRVRIGLGIHRDTATFIGTDIQPGPLVQPATWNLPERLDGLWITGKVDPSSPHGRRIRD